MYEVLKKAYINETSKAYHNDYNKLQLQVHKISLVNVLIIITCNNNNNFI